MLGNKDAVANIAVRNLETARKFYESCGFTVEGEEQTRFGPALRMTK